MARRYVILGNGIAGQTCAEELRRMDPSSSIEIVAAEQHPLYNRVALPRYLRGQVREERVLMRTIDDYAARDLLIHFETAATKIDAAHKVVHTTKGHVLKYDALLVATGGRPAPPPWPGVDQLSRIFQFHTLEDANRIIASIDTTRRALVMGGSYISYELADALAHRGVQVTWLIRGPRFLHRVLDREGGELCRQLGQEKGVEFVVDDDARYFENWNGRCRVETAKGRRLEFDALYYGVGLVFRADIVSGTGVRSNRGIVTDSRLRTDIPDIFAAGDIAAFHDVVVGGLNQMGTWDNALAQGKVAAHNMAGASEDFVDIPTYTTTMFGSTLAVMGVTSGGHGDLDSVQTYSYETKMFRKLFFYDDRLVGAILIGSPKGRKQLLEIIRSRERISGIREELLDLGNVKELQSGL